MVRKTANLKAVFDSDLKQLLEKLGVLDSLLLGEYHCEVCGCPVDLDNLGTIFSREDKVGVTCDKSTCIRVITSRQTVKQSG